MFEWLCTSLLAPVWDRTLDIVSSHAFITGVAITATAALLIVAGQRLHASWRAR